jgi:hypothetical protein
MLFAVVDECIDPGVEVVHGLEGTGADRLVVDQCEPSLDLIYPGTERGREVLMEPWTPRQPRTNRRMLVGRREILRLRRKIEVDPAQSAFIVVQRGARCSLDALVDVVR